MMHVVIKTIITREELCMGKSCSIQKIAPLWGAPVSGGNALECVCALSGFKGMLLDQAHCKAIGPSCLLQWRTVPETHRMVTSRHHTWDTRSRFDRSTQDRKAYPFEKQPGRKRRGSCAGPVRAAGVADSSGCGSLGAAAAGDAQGPGAALRAGGCAGGASRSPRGNRRGEPRVRGLLQCYASA